jgi:predicted nucleic-acid-binding protein
VIALDTNVLVRYLVADDEEQAARAAALIEDTAGRGDAMFISNVVVCELVWVLGRAYRLPKPRLVEAVANVVRTAQFVVEDADLVGRALYRYRDGGADFADYLIAEAAAAAGCVQVATFDKRLLREDGFTSP